MPAMTYICNNPACRHRTTIYQHPCPVCTDIHRTRGECVLVVDLTDEDYNYRVEREALIPLAEKATNAKVPGTEWSSVKWSRVFAREMGQLAYDRGLVAYPPRD